MQLTPGVMKPLKIVDDRKPSPQAAEARELVAALRAAKHVRWHRPTSVALMPWRVIVDGTVLAVFVKERDARGFAQARYGDEAIVVPRGRGRAAARGNE